MEKLVLRKADDFHLHLRNGDMLRAVLPHTARQFRRAIVMPNTAPPVLDETGLSRYRAEIRKAAREAGFPDFEPLMTIQITDDTTPEMIEKANMAGAVAGKVYPRGMTTNSANGVYDYQSIHPALAAMQECGMPVLFHGESPNPAVFCLDREKQFLPIVQEIARSFPRLKVVMEHVTTADAVNWVDACDHNVAATITAHHLLITLDDVIGDKLMPHNFCKPVAKRPEDCDKLITAAMGANPKFFLGTDSAPHLQGAKECASGCAGVYTAPIVMPLLVQLFDQYGELNKLENFASGYGADFYELERNKETTTFVREDWTVPAIYDGVVPFMAGKELNWRME